MKYAHLRNLRITRLESGWWHIRGNGPCEWAQPRDWPCAPTELEASFFPEASREFRREAAAENERLLRSPSTEMEP